MLIPNAPAVNQMEDSSNLVPEATYEFIVAKAEYVDKPKGPDAKGPYIKTQMRITGPGDVSLGRMIFMNYSMTGPASFRLRELLTVTGHDETFRLEDDQHLVGLEFKGVVGTEAAKDGYPAKSVIKRHMPMIPVGV